MAKKVVVRRQGTKAEYLALTQRPDNVLYFCTDTGELYRGDTLYTDGVRKINSNEDLPELDAAADGKMYYCADTHCGYVLKNDRTGWEQIIFGVDDETVEISENGLIKVKAVPLDSVTGLRGKLIEIEQKINSGGGDVGMATDELAGIVKGSDEIKVGEDGTMTINEIALEKVTGLDDRLNGVEAAIVWENMDGSAD